MVVVVIIIIVNRRRSSSVCVCVHASAADCGSPPAVSNASTGTYLQTTYLSDVIAHSHLSDVIAHSHLSDVTFTCQPGHFFHRDVFVKTVTCQADGIWTDIKSCVRKSAVFFYRVYLF